MRYETASATVAAYVNANLPVMLWGAPGVGKSDLVAQVAASGGRDLVDERLSTLESVDLRGQPRVIGDSVAWARPTMFARLWDSHDAGRPSMLFLDEINAAAPSVQAAAFQLVLNRRVGEHALPDDCVVVAAGNRQSDKAAAQRMPSALANRFAHVDIEPDADAWRAWAAGAGLSPLVIAFLAFRPALIHAMEGADLRAFPSPRAWASVARIADAPADLRPALVRGLVGEAAAGEFEAFARIWTRLPSIESILANPDGAPVPSASEPALLYAVATGVARKATRANMGAVIRFAARLPAEFAFLMVADATRRDAGLKETRAFIDFSVANQGVLA